ncbi:MAG: SDR family oxidoreductase [Advenella sp.]|nr:SDR family oxidoreductase [Advenella sp.]
MKGLKNKVALISGGMGDIGMAIATRLMQEGARVVLGDLKAKDAALLAARFQDGQVPDYVQLDVTRAESWKSAFEQVVALHGRCDVLVNNAGVISTQSVPFSDIDFQEWKRLFTINVDGTFLGIQAGITAMQGNENGGAIVNMGSIAGFVGSVGGGSYGSSKSAIINMTQQAALSAARSGQKVRINAVHPGYVWTQLVDATLSKQFGSEEKALEAVRAMNPMNQIVSVNDVAAAVVFLASEDARMINGTGIVVDGGRLLQ